MRPERKRRPGVGRRLVLPTGDEPYCAATENVDDAITPVEP